MLLLKKTILLLTFFLILNIFSIYGFDYENFLTDNKISVVKQKDNINGVEQKTKTFNLVLVKKDGVVEMNGLFSNEDDVKKISDILSINREGEYKYEDDRVINEELLNEVAKLILPFKDFFADNSKLTILDNKVTLNGQLKDSDHKDLLDSIISRTNLDLKVEYTLPNVEKVNENSEQIDKILDSNENNLQTNNAASKLNEVQLFINNILATNKINFERRSTKVTPDSKIAVEQIAKLLEENINFKIEVAGHTDSRGSNALNKKISQDRASSVREILISLGINKDRVTAVGYGEDFPLVKDDENGLSEINRRVEFNILGEIGL